MRYLLIIFGAFLLTACFDIREEVWIERDGSGRFEFSYTLPTNTVTILGGEESLRERIDETVAASDEIQLDEISFTTSEKNTTIRVAARCDSLASLADLAPEDGASSLPSAVSDLAGDLEIKIGLTGIDFHREVDLGSALGLRAIPTVTKSTQERALTYIMHLPVEPTSHNADSTADEGRTLIWKRPLDEALRSPIDMRFHYPFTIPPWAIAALVGLGVLLVFLIVRRLTRRR